MGARETLLKLVRTPWRQLSRFKDHRRKKRTHRRVTNLEALPRREYSRTVASRRVVEPSGVIVARQQGDGFVQQFSTSERSLSHLEGTKVFAHYGLIMTRRGHLLEESVAERSILTKRIEKGRLSEPFDTIALDRPTYSLSVNPNYYHFWHDTLPPLLLLHEPEVEALGEIFVTFTRDLSPWRRQVIEAAIPPWATLRRVDERSLVASPLTVFPSPYRSKAFSPAIIEHLDSCGRALAPDLPRSTSTPPSQRSASRDRLYISRRHANWRRALNEEALTRELRDRGFDVIHAEALAQAEQIRRFQGAEMVIGQHGAGLTNLLFAPPETRVLELHSGDPGSAGSHYQALAASRGQRHTAIGGNAANANSDVELPIAAVLDWIDSQS